MSTTTLSPPSFDDEDDRFDDADVVDLDQARQARRTDRVPDDGPEDEFADEFGDDTPEDTEAAPSVPVDQAPASGDSDSGFAARAETLRRRPVLPEWAKSGQAFSQAASGAASLGWHVARFHAVRVPWYALLLALRSPRGFGRSARGLLRWTFDAEGRPVRAEAVRRNNAEEYLKLSRQRDRRVAARATAFAAVLVTVLILGLYLAFTPDSGMRLLIFAGLLALFGAAGSTADRPLIGASVVDSRYGRPTSEQVVQALAALGLAPLSRAIAKGAGVTFPEPIVNDGPGYRITVDLPHGVTADDVINRRNRLASGLRRPLGCVWPEPVPGEHEGRLVIWVGRQELAKSKQPAWPLAKTGKVDLFKRFPIGFDQRGRSVDIVLMFASMIIGAIPRMGKTFLLRLILLAASLDPRAELHVFNLKGTGDFAVLKPVCHRYGNGDEDDDIAYLYADLVEVQTEQRRRGRIITDLAENQPHRCPENKVTPELAEDPKLRLYPIVVALDECQKAFEHPKYGAKIEEICTDLVKRGPALGIIAILATQRPDAKSLPTGISANAVLRFCLKVMGHTENDMVLGSGMHKAGFKATTLSRSDLGIGLLAGEGDDPRVVRSCYLDAQGCKPIVDRARAMRLKAGTLSGDAVGDTLNAAAASVAFDLLADILAVVPVTEDKVWNSTIVTRLAELRPDVYGGWSAAMLTGSLKPFGINVGQTWASDPETGTSGNRQGLVRADVVAAARAKATGTE